MDRPRFLLLQLFHGAGNVRLLPRPGSFPLVGPRPVVASDGDPTGVIGADDRLDDAPDELDLAREGDDAQVDVVVAAREILGGFDS